MSFLPFLRPATFLLLLAAACGGTTSSTADAGPTGHSDGSPSIEGAAPADGATGDTASPGTDSSPRGTDGATPSDGGIVSDPGTVACGAMTCMTPMDLCCVTPAGSSCQPSGPMACPGGRRIECDQAADCATGQVCCIVPGQGPLSLSAVYQCAPTCIRNAIAYQACRTAAECETPGPCVAQTCGGQVFDTCGAIPPMGCN